MAESSEQAHQVEQSDVASYPDAEQLGKRRRSSLGLIPLKYDQLVFVAATCLIAEMSGCAAAPKRDLQYLDTNAAYKRSVTAETSADDGGSDGLAAAQARSASDGPVGGGGDGVRAFPLVSWPSWISFDYDDDETQAAYAGLYDDGRGFSDGGDVQHGRARRRTSSSPTMTGKSREVPGSVDVFEDPPVPSSMGLLIREDPSALRRVERSPQSIKGPSRISPYGDSNRVFEEYHKLHPFAKSPAYTKLANSKTYLSAYSPETAEMMRKHTRFGFRG